MYLIAGLGNPTREYEGTRHNMGFDCVDVLADKYGIKLKKSRFGALIGKGTILKEQVLLVKPLTYMNLSGNAIGPIAKYYKIDTKSRLIVIYDDTDLEIGKIRVRKKGSAGGHNGMKSIISHIGEDFIRVRVGIGKRAEKTDMVDFVLGRFSGNERAEIEEALKQAAMAAVEVIENGCDSAMNKYN